MFLVLSSVFRRAIRLGFPACWRQAYIISIPEGPQSSSVVNYRPTSLTSVLSKVLVSVSVHLGRFMGGGVFQPPSLLIRKVLVPMMHCCARPIHCKVNWRMERRLGSCRFISAQPVTWVNREGILYKLCSVGIGGSVLSTLTQFLSNLSQHVMVDGCRSKMFNILSGVRQGSVLGPWYCSNCTHRSLFPFRTISLSAQEAITANYKHWEYRLGLRYFRIWDSKCSLTLPSISSMRGE